MGLIGTFFRSAFWTAVILFGGSFLLYQGAVIVFGVHDDVIRVRYLGGMRVCEGGYDFHRPVCSRYSEEELKLRVWDIRWALVDRRKGEFVRYDGWYRERTEIMIDFENDTLPDDIPKYGLAGQRMLPYVLRDKYERWEDVDWELVECDLEGHRFNRVGLSDHCWDLRTGKVQTEKQQEDARKATYRRWITYIVVGLMWVAVLVGALLRMVLSMGPPSQ